MIHENTFPWMIYSLCLKLLLLNLQKVYFWVEFKESILFQIWLNVFFLKRRGFTASKDNCNFHTFIDIMSKNIKWLEQLKKLEIFKIFLGSFANEAFDKLHLSVQNWSMVPNYQHFHLLYCWWSDNHIIKI